MPLNRLFAHGQHGVQVKGKMPLKMKLKWKLKLKL